MKLFRCVQKWTASYRRIDIVRSRRSRRQPEDRCCRPRRLRGGAHAGAAMAASVCASSRTPRRCWLPRRARAAGGTKRRNEKNDRLRSEQKEAVLAGSRARDATASRALIWSIAQGCARKSERPAPESRGIHLIHSADRRRTSHANLHGSLTRLGASGTHTDAPKISLAEQSKRQQTTSGFPVCREEERAEEADIKT